MAGNECGNAVALRHDGDWETRFCYLENGAIRKWPVDIVLQGEVSVQVGMSSLNNFAHLHLSVSKNSQTVDPFVPEHANVCLQNMQDRSWRTAPAYSPTTCFTIVFSLKIPRFDEVKSGTARLSELPIDCTALALYQYAFSQKLATRYISKLLVQTMLRLRLRLRNALKQYNCGCLIPFEKRAGPEVSKTGPYLCGAKTKFLPCVKSTLRPHHDPKVHTPKPHKDAHHLFFS
ncbi:MAG: M23 family metallopeptidase [Paracoccaceae bacterium]|nr:M23 family metallopeptidase [Paracoccaceae bacterium]